MSLTQLKEVMVLGAVRAHPAHGYALADLLGEGLGETVGLTRPTVYATLQRFEKRGWLRCRTVQDRRFPDREVYSLTRAGDQAYLRLLHACAAEIPLSVMPLVALLAHLEDLAASERREVLQAIRDARKNRIKQLSAMPAHEGLAAVAFDLMLKTLRLEVRTIDALLA